MNPSKCFIPPGSRGLLCQSVPPRAAADLDACENAAPINYSGTSAAAAEEQELFHKMYPTKLGISYFKQHIDRMWRCVVDEASLV